MNPTLKITYASLLHDIGKMIQRYDSETTHRSKNHMDSGALFLNEIGLSEFAESVRYHHFSDFKNSGIKDPYIPFVILGDRLSAAERTGETKAAKQFNPMVSLLNPFYNIRFKAREGRGKPSKTFFNADEMNQKMPVPMENNQSVDQAGYYQKNITALREKLSDFSKLEANKDNLPYLLSILEKHTTFIPSETNQMDLLNGQEILRDPDITLYDHLRTSAMIGASAFEYVKDVDEVYAKAPKDASDYNRLLQLCESQNPFLLVLGDISGVQDYIYTISSKGALRSLKARSFQLELIQEVFVNHFLNDCGLSVIHVLYIGGGHFHLILPNTTEVKEKLEAHKNKANDYFRENDMNLRLLISHTPFSAQELAGKNNQSFTDVHKVISGQNRVEKAHPLLNELKKEFDQSNQKEAERCKICGKQTDRLFPLADDQEREACLQCFQLSEAGKLLNRFDFLSQVSDETGDLTILGDTFKFTGRPESQTGINFCFNPDKMAHHCIYVPISRYKNDDNKGFEGLAEKAKGKKYLGTLRMDVDYLGTIFGGGIQNPSISRVATISRFLTNFFRCYLDDILQDLYVTVVYSGGDDLYLVGAWNDTIQAAKRIREHFSQYCGHSQFITISGGIVVTKPKEPVYRVSRIAEEAEAMAKSHVWSYGSVSVEKDAICLFYHTGENEMVKSRTTINWDTFLEKTVILKKLLEKSSGNAFLRKLYSIEDMYRDAEKMPLYKPMLAYIKAREKETENQSIARELLQQDWLPVLWCALQWTLMEKSTNTEVNHG